MRKIYKIRYARLHDVFCFFWGMTIAIWVRTYFDTLYSIKRQLRVVIHDKTPLDHFFNLSSLLIAISTKFTIKYRRHSLDSYEFHEFEFTSKK